ncbi:MAG TPA: SUMF1/EgtB/PvdO family nonheme iron enzyme [Steroidobacteraceae bacterium]|nr:SUMF1/EgtB/PvdO family nonheme iron enzyme [Steroidobacteraceae bacterium]
MLSIHEPLGSREAQAPLRIGGAPAELIVPGVAEPAASVDSRGSQWWLNPLVDAVLLNGMPLHEPVVLADGDVLQVGDAQLVFDAAGPALQVAHLAGNATVAPLQQDVLPGEAVSAGAAEITAAVESGAQRSAAARAARRRSSAWLVAVPLGAVALAALVMLFRLVTVPVQVTPASARIEVPGWFNWRSGESLYLLPGVHRVHAAATGHASLDVDVDAQAAAVAGTPLRITLPLLPGEVAVDTGGVAGELLLDGRSLGAVPGVVSIPAGEHEISIRAPRHVDQVVKLRVEGAGRRQSLQVKLLPVFGWLVLDTAPAGAVVRVDDQERGRAPLRLELDAGLRRLSITAPGRRGWNSQVPIQSGQTLDLGVIDLALPAPVVASAPAASAAPEPAQPAAAASPPPAPPPPAARIHSPLLGALVLLPAGSYMQGSDRREQGRRSNEVLRKATLSRPFYLAEKEVTNAQFRVFRAQHASGFAMEKSLDLDNQAVSSVSWGDAVEFCNWLSLREGLPVAYERREGRWQLMQPGNHGYRLPTEAEWEYAARRVDGQAWRRYAWGDQLPPPPAADNLGGQESLPQRPGPEQRLAAALPGYRDEHAVVAPVGSYARSAPGLYDMGGNVSEWVHDVYTSLPDASPVTDPVGADSEGPHAVRGANWRTASIAELRLAWRDRATGASQTLGFRVARSVESTP